MGDLAARWILLYHRDGAHCQRRRSEGLAQVRPVALDAALISILAQEPLGATENEKERKTQVN